jgi:L-lactate permease
MKPPRMKVLATTTGVKRWALIALPNSSPRMTAGMKAISTLTVKRCACRLVGRAATVSRIFFQYTMITARMAPVWIAMSKTLAFRRRSPAAHRPG